MGIQLDGINLIEMAPGICGILLGAGSFMMITSVIIAGKSKSSLFLSFYIKKYWHFIAFLECNNFEIV